MEDLRFRQVHLDFHTSEMIEGIGSKFSKEQFQEMLKLGHVDSITVFSKCHHGWSYHPTEEGAIHPHLKFDLLGAMIEAAHEIGVNTPVYLSAGFDQRLARLHPEWLRRNKDESLISARSNSFFTPGYHCLCMNTPYLDIFVSQIEEALRNYNADGLFLDIAGVAYCYCQKCVGEMMEEGKDPRDEDAVNEHSKRVYANYADRVRRAVDAIMPGLPVYHNEGHIKIGRRELIATQTHFELETIATGGWGYDSFPFSAAYARTLGILYTGVTGRFHRTWGDFGGYKHPNTLRYETSRHLTHGARCSVGDQLHPNGEMDKITYAMIGASFSEVEKKEPWCRGAVHLADVAVLGAEEVFSVEGPNTGAMRILTEGKYLFNIIDEQEDFSKYKVVVLPDSIRVGQDLKIKLGVYLAGGGKLLATGASGLGGDGSFVFDFGAKALGENEYCPDFIRPSFELPCYENAAFVMYSPGGQLLELTDGKELAIRENPYFNRDMLHFCSHFHTPSDCKNAGPGMVWGKDGIYIAWSIFTEYASKGSMIAKLAVHHALDLLLGDGKTLQTTLPSQGAVTLAYQRSDSRYVNHLLYGVPYRRGDRGVIEDIIPVYNVDVTLRLDAPVKGVKLVPQMEDIPFVCRGGEVSYTVPKVDCHQMVEIQT